MRIASVIWDVTYNSTDRHDGRNNAANAIY